MNYHDNAIRLLAEGFKEDFCEFLEGHDALHDAMMEVAHEFVDRNIPIVKEDDATDVAIELMGKVYCSTLK